MDKNAKNLSLSIKDNWPNFSKHFMYFCRDKKSPFEFSRPKLPKLNLNLKSKLTWFLARKFKYLIYSKIQLLNFWCFWTNNWVLPQCGNSNVILDHQMHFRFCCQRFFLSFRESRDIIEYGESRGIVDAGFDNNLCRQ